MVDIDRQIEVAKKKPLTAENLNYIGDLYLKKDDKKRAVAYFFEAGDKFHFAQKEKKIAIYKKIMNVSPASEKAYIGIIEIFSKMGLVMEEKKYLHMLAQLYDNRGDTAASAELFAKIRELDPHVIQDGTFFHRDAHREVIESGEGRQRQETPSKEGAGRVIWPEEQTAPAMPVSAPAVPVEEEKLIEASLEEIPYEERYPAKVEMTEIVRWRFSPVVIIILSLLLAAGVVYYFAGNRLLLASLPVSARVNNYEITVSRLADRAELAGIFTEQEQAGKDFLVLTVTSPGNCIPDAFATAPYNMISLRDKKGGATHIKPAEGLRKTSRSITKMNVCGRDNAIVFVRVIVPVDPTNRYVGLSLEGLQDAGPLTITWDLK